MKTSEAKTLIDERNPTSFIRLSSLKGEVKSLFVRGAFVESFKSKITVFVTNDRIKASYDPGPW